MLLSQPRGKELSDGDLDIHPRIITNVLIKVNTNVIDSHITIVFMYTLAERLKWARDRKQLTQQQLADRAGVKQSTIGNIESGTRLDPRFLVEIAVAVGVDPVWLALGKGSPDYSLPEGWLDLGVLSDAARDAILSIVAADNADEPASTFKLVQRLFHGRNDPGADLNP